MELIERITKLEVTVQDHEKKLDNLEKLTAATSELAFSVKEIASDMSELKDKVVALSINFGEDYSLSATFIRL